MKTDVQASTPLLVRTFATLRLGFAGVLLVILAACGGGAGSPASDSSAGSVPSGNNSAPTTPSVTSGSPDNRAQSIARIWNIVLLEAIRRDRTRPPVQARNLFHISAAVYDAWAAFDGRASTYLLGKTVQGFNCPLPVIPATADVLLAREQALSHAAYQMIKHRYVQSPGYEGSLSLAGNLMKNLGYDANMTATTATLTTPAHLGNYIADCYIRYGLQDGSNEAGSHANRFYAPVNKPLVPEFAGNPNITDLDRWQPLSLAFFVDQSGNAVFGGAASFVGAEWGNTWPFAMTAANRTLFQRAGATYPVYHDPGAPPSIQGNLAAEYQWSFAMVSKWSSHLDPNDGVMIDISPGAIGAVEAFPDSFEAQRRFYDDRLGGDRSSGRRLNPATGAAYAPQMVPRGDYTRVLAEFWADGPSSETPPGHWYSILNTVMTHPQFQRRFKGVGPELGTLEWDVKAYFALGGAMHDAAIAAWGVKGWYDGVRPISAIRAMADRGQSSDPAQPRYHPKGLPLDPGFIEQVSAADPLAGSRGEHVGKVKLRAWRGPLAVGNPQTSTAGVGWVLAENWWPFQKSTFVTPPFAGYVSGHSTYSRAAAEVLTALTGDPYFPGGMGTFGIGKNAFLTIEKGPSVDVTLQWATYRDAADQCSLSRIWGGIHPPMDDIAGRRIGARVGQDAFAAAERLFATP